jgi:hypothetical protein
MILYFREIVSLDKEGDFRVKLGFFCTYAERFKNLEFLFAFPKTLIPKRRMTLRINKK